jgi:hypothetical protein
VLSLLHNRYKQLQTRRARFRRHPFLPSDMAR